MPPSDAARTRADALIAGLQAARVGWSFWGGAAAEVGAATDQLEHVTPADLAFGF